MSAAARAVPELIILYLKSAPPRKEYLDARKPLVKLVEEQKRDIGHIHIRKDGLSISAGRNNVNAPVIRFLSV